jgi:hypothetical protein
MVHFIIYGRAALSFEDYMDFMRRTSWKIIRGENGCRNMGTIWKYVFVVGDAVGTWRLCMTNSSWIFGGVMEGVVINLKCKQISAVCTEVMIYMMKKLYVFKSCNGPFYSCSYLLGIS